MVSFLLYMSCFYVIFILLSDFGITNADDHPSDVAIIEEIKSETEILSPGTMPESLGFKLRLVHGEKPVHLRLKKNNLKNEEKEVVVIREDSNGNTYLEKENIPTVKNTAMYQDNTTQAVFTVTCSNLDMGDCQPILLGSVNVGGEEYDFHPLKENLSVRKKRAARRYGEPRSYHNSHALKRHPTHGKYSQKSKYPGNNLHDTYTGTSSISQESMENQLQQHLERFPTLPSLDNIGNPNDFKIDNQFVQDVKEAPKEHKRLYAAFKREPRKEIKSDCIGNKEVSSKNSWKSIQARRHRQRTVTVQGRNPQIHGQSFRKNLRTIDTQNTVAAKQYYITLVVVVDYSIYMRWFNASKERNVRKKDMDAKSKIRMYFAHVVNGIDLRYQNIKHADFAISVSVAEYIIADHPNFSPWTTNFVNKDPPRYVGVWDALNKLVDWKEKMFRRLPPHDHVMLFTGEDLYETRTQDPSVTGYAHVRTVCTKKSASINEDHGAFGGIITATHELAHSLGANHDGEWNPCLATDQFIMTAMGGDTNQANRLNPWKFSECSLQYFKDYIEELNSKGENCMTDVPVDIDPDFHRIIQQMPGQVAGPNEQCRQLLGKDSYYGWGGGLGRFQDICTNMACKNTKKEDSFHLYNAARGTSCGNKRWCVNGECVWDRKAPAKEGRCVHGDSLKPLHNSTCKALIKARPARCYNREYREFCCESCKKSFTGKKRCEYGDKIPSCVLVKPRPYLCYDNKNSKLCCISCSKLHSGIKGCEYGDRKSGCDKRLCHTRDHQLNCCKTCGTKDKTSIKSSSRGPSTKRGKRVNIHTPVKVVHSILPTTTHRIPASSTRFRLQFKTDRKKKENNQKINVQNHNNIIRPEEDLIPDPFAPGMCVRKNAFYRQDVPCEFLAKWLSLCTETRFKNTCCRSCNIDRKVNAKIECRDSPFCTARTGADCYDKATRDNCCATCSKFETGFMLCPYGDKDSRCGLMLQLNRKYYCENYGSTCCESCFKVDRRPQNTTPRVFIDSIQRPSASRHPSPSTVNRINSGRRSSRTRNNLRARRIGADIRTGGQLTNRNAPKPTPTSATNIVKIKQNLKRFIEIVNRFFT